MNCLKCGNQVPDNQVFCNSCLEEMKKYPVSPDMPVLLPDQAVQEAVRRPVRRYRRILEPEERISRQKKIIRFLVSVILILILAAGIFAGLVCWYFAQSKEQKPNVGQNYIAQETT